MLSKLKSAWVLIFVSILVFGGIGINMSCAQSQGPQGPEGPQGPPGAGDGHSLDALDGSLTDVVYVNIAGNVGIGKTNPSAKLEVVGDVKVNGIINTTKVSYSSPRTHHLSIPVEAFVPDRNVDYYNLGGPGGAYIVTGAAAMVAPVHLPRGAQITKFQVFFVDNSASNLVVYLKYYSIFTGQSHTIATVDSSEVSDSGYKSKTISHIVDNARGTYSVRAHSTSWDGNQCRIMGVLITYELNEVP